MRIPHHRTITPSGGDPAESDDKNRIPRGMGAFKSQRRNQSMFECASIRMCIASFFALRRVIDELLVYPAPTVVTPPNLPVHKTTSNRAPRTPGDAVRLIPLGPFHGYFVG